jgi:hypothetical protein
MFREEGALGQPGLPRSTVRACLFDPAIVEHSEMGRAATKKTWPLQHEQESREPLGSVMKFLWWNAELS